MRALASLVNEGAKILAEGIAARSIDIDAVWVNGYGFPPYQGGPMYWADKYGIARLVHEIERFSIEDQNGWRLAPLLAELSETKRTFADWSASRRIQ
jgi:3-hydroxyacyl-CoA dehydrogenase